MADSGRLVLRMEFLRSRKRPLRLSGGMGSKAWRISWPSEIANNEILVRELAMQVGFEMGEIEHALPKTVADDNDPLFLPSL